MGLVDLMQHMSMERQQDSRRRRAQATNGSVASRDKINSSPCQRDNDSQGGELDIQIPNLPEVRYAILLIVGLVQVTCQ